MGLCVTIQYSVWFITNTRYLRKICFWYICELVRSLFTVTIANYFCWLNPWFEPFPAISKQILSLFMKLMETVIISVPPPRTKKNVVLTLGGGVISTLVRRTPKKTLLLCVFPCPIIYLCINHLRMYNLAFKFEMGDYILCIWVMSMSIGYAYCII